jgi:hypothetical protein
MNLNRKEKGKEFLKPLAKQAETTCSPAQVGVLSLLSPSHSAGCGPPGYWPAHGAHGRCTSRAPDARSRRGAHVGKQCGVAGEAELVTDR